MSKIVLITGATSGYGLSAAKKFKENGDTVIIASRNAKKVEETVKKYGFDDGYKLDVTVYDEWESVKEEIMKKYGRVDVLVNNAGGGIRIADTVEQTHEDIDKSIALNLTSAIYGSKLFGDVMKKQGDGVIINISSVCAKQCWGKWAIYTAAKTGMVNFTKCLYIELRPFGVRATCIIPASASSYFTKSAGLHDGEYLLEASDVANAIFYVASQPKGVFVEEMTVWGTAQDVQPL